MGLHGQDVIDQQLWVKQQEQRPGEQEAPAPMDVARQAFCDGAGVVPVR